MQEAACWDNYLRLRQLIESASCRHQCVCIGSSIRLLSAFLYLQVRFLKGALARLKASGGAFLKQGRFISYIRSKVLQPPEMPREDALEVSSKNPVLIVHRGTTTLPRHVHSRLRHLFWALVP
jgi:hypothetical protein